MDMQHHTKTDTHACRFLKNGRRDVSGMRKDHLMRRLLWSLVWYNMRLVIIYSTIIALYFIGLVVFIVDAKNWDDRTSLQFEQKWTIWFPSEILLLQIHFVQTDVNVWSTWISSWTKNTQTYKMNGSDGLMRLRFVLFCIIIRKEHMRRSWFTGDTTQWDETIYLCSIFILYRFYTRLFSLTKRVLHSTFSVMHFKFVLYFENHIECARI